MASMVIGLSHLNIPFGKFITTFLKSISTGPDRNECSAPERILRLLVPDAGSGLWLQLPFHYAYGTNIKAGEF